MKRISVLFILILLLFSCSRNNSEDLPEENNNTIPIIIVKSTAFENEKDIPVKFTCDGENVSPELEWEEIPENSKSIVLICEDPDAPVGIWVHWVVYDIPPNSASLKEGIESGEKIKDGGTQGKNSWGKTEYGGPCPPPGKPHRYLFKIYTLDIELNLEPGKTKSEIEEAMKDHITAQGQILGYYGR